MYDLAIISYVLALGHFVLEFVVFRTAGLGPGLISPFIVASKLQRDGCEGEAARAHVMGLFLQQRVLSG